MKICQIEGCGKPFLARGLCSAHYERLRKHGDPLGGDPPRGGPAKFLEQAISYSGDDCLIWPFSRTHGYGQLTYKSKHTIAHIFICISAHGPRPTRRHEAAHSCGNGSSGCINPRHLRWATPKENQADRIIHGTSNRGERHGMSKLSDEDVRYIRGVPSDITNVSIANELGVSDGLISMIRSRRRWAHVE